MVAGGSQLTRIREQNQWAQPSQPGHVVIELVGHNLTKFSCGMTKSTAAPSCTSIRSKCPYHPSGFYWVQLGAGSRQLYCDMESFDGGWALIGQHCSKCKETSTDFTLIGPAQNSTALLSDENINSIGANLTFWVQASETTSEAAICNTFYRLVSPNQFGANAHYDALRCSVDSVLFGPTFQPEGSGLTTQTGSNSFEACGHGAKSSSLWLPTENGKDLCVNSGADSSANKWLWVRHDNDVATNQVSKWKLVSSRANQVMCNDPNRWPANGHPEHLSDQISLTECQIACEREPECKAIDYSPNLNGATDSTGKVKSKCFFHRSIRSCNNFKAFTSPSYIFEIWEYQDATEKVEDEEIESLLSCNGDASKIATLDRAELLRLLDENFAQSLRNLAIPELHNMASGLVQSLVDGLSQEVVGTIKLAGLEFSESWPMAHGSKFVHAVASLIGKSIEDVHITSVTPGSVVVAYSVKAEATQEAFAIANVLKQSTEDGNLQKRLILNGLVECADCVITSVVEPTPKVSLSILLERLEQVGSKERLIELTRQFIDHEASILTTAELDKRLIDLETELSLPHTEISSREGRIEQLKLLSTLGKSASELKLGLSKLLGNDPLASSVDEHGCIQNLGFHFCEAQNRCVQSFIGGFGAPCGIEQLKPPFWEDLPEQELKDFVRKLEQNINNRLMTQLLRERLLNGNTLIVEPEEPKPENVMDAPQEITTCPPNSHNFPQCDCDIGFRGKINMMELSGVCDIVPCPPGSDGHPLCQCHAGRSGNLIWNFETQSYDGECSSCAKGFWADSAFEPCHFVHGPPNSTNHPDVTCKDGFGGDVVWREDIGVFSGNCTECPYGTWSTIRETTCEKISCPENADSWPECECIPGFSGKIEFSQGEFTGTCQACTPGTFKAEAGSSACEVCPMGFTSGQHSPHCHKVACPPNSSGHPFCQCHDKTAGTITWSASGTYSGECLDCELGTYPSPDHTRCLPVDCPFGSAWPDCACREGFFGNPIVDLITGVVDGSCSRCPAGFWCPAGKPCHTSHDCVAVDCPINSHGRGNCACNDGFVGVLAWNDLAGQYQGECLPCPKSQWSNETTKSSLDGCYPVPCPPGSEGFPNCQCKLGFVGSPAWDESLGLWQGECAYCSTGTWSSLYTDLTCVEVPCPPFSTGWPDCACLPDHLGQISWDSQTGSWTGYCGDGSCPELSTGYPHCKCIEGYAGDFHWSAEKLNFDGSCRPCEPGTWALEGSERCTPAECPENAQGWPDCQCEAGYYGTLIATQSLTYAGSCLPCEPGYWSEAGDVECHKIACPENAFDHPNCACGVNYAGHIVWQEGEWHGECNMCPFGSQSPLGSSPCTQIPCPGGASGWPRCRCDEGYEGIIELYPNETSYRGSCTRCDRGYSSAVANAVSSVDPVFSSKMTCQAVECPEHARGWPFCHCVDGYQGALQLIGEAWYGSCTPCPSGFISQFVTGGPGPRQCSFKPCPANSLNHPNCACQQGYYGTVSWVVTEGGGQFVGACEQCVPGKYAPAVGLGECRSCPPGNWSRPGASWCDIRLQCPSNSILTPEGLCECEANHFGSVHLDRASGKTRGQCEPCRVGYSAPQGSTVCNKVPCPDSTFDSHPFCECPQGMAGHVVFSGKLGKYEGQCERCPIGSWPNEHGDCEPVPCPNNAEKTSDGLCRCSGNTRGAIEWDAETGSFVGECAECEAKGYAVNRDRTMCVPAACPALALFHPQCSCQPGAFGNPVWNSAQGVWEGRCQLCPAFSYTYQNQTRECSMPQCPPRSVRNPNTRECQCAAGTTGVLTFSNGVWKGACSSSNCPRNSHVQGQMCVCNEGFAGTSVSVQTFLASRQRLAEKEPCTKCRTGEVRDNLTTKCTPKNCPPNSSFWPRCVCQQGFVGQITWAETDFVGSCQACPVGFAPSDDGSYCKQIPCPAGTGRHPTCVATPPHYGNITWDPVQRNFVGTVEKCAIGFVSDSTKCNKVDCPPLSHGWPKCECDESHAGFVAWTGTGFESHCEACPVGTRSNKAVSCAPVPLPAHAVNPEHPYCEAGFEGRVEWNNNQGVYEGECVPCKVGFWSSSGQCREVACPVGTTLTDAGSDDKVCLCEPPLQGVLSFSFGTWVGQCIAMPELPVAPPKTEPIGPSASPSPSVMPSVAHPQGSCLAQRVASYASESQCTPTCIEDSFLGGTFAHKQCCRGECWCVDELGAVVPGSTRPLAEGATTCKGINCINLSAKRHCLSSVGTKESLKLPNTFVVEGWVRPHYNAQFRETLQPILSGLGPTGEANFVAGVLDQEGQSLPFIRFHGEQLLGRIPLKAQAWHHLAFVFDMHELPGDPDNRPSLSLYVNGTKDLVKQLEEVPRSSLVSLGDEEITLGHAQVDGADHVFTGSFGEITVWGDRIRTDQIQQAMVKKPVGEKPLFRAQFLDNGHGTPQLVLEAQGKTTIMNNAITCATLECTGAPGHVRELVPIANAPTTPPIKKAPLPRYDPPSPSPSPRRDPRPLVLSAPTQQLIFEGGIEMSIQ